MALRHYRLRHTVVVINSITAVIRPCIKLTATLRVDSLRARPCLQSKLKLQHNTVISAYRRRCIKLTATLPGTHCVLTLSTHYSLNRN